ncbi:MAG: NosD domain-containing protein [Euryarchaeota archaeon]|nr:NosD domain-containing protein [Euryarchaeota archaeon]
MRKLELAKAPSDHGGCGMTRVLLVIVAVLACAGTAAGATWVVDDDGGAGVDYMTIQGAVDASSAGDTIEVASGTYRENVDVDKRVTLIGDGADVVTVRAADAGDHVFEVTADYVSISGFMATGATGGCVSGIDASGIHLNGVDHCNISDNDASGNRDGICPYYGSSNNTLTSNTASGNYLHGIYLRGSSNNTLASNIASGNRDGIHLSDSGNNTLQGNTMSGNMYNFGVLGGPSILSDYTQNIDVSNTVEGKPIYYWVDQHDKQIMGDAGFVAAVNSTNITVKDLTLTNNIQGVLFACTEKSRIENVSASDNRWSIYLRGSSNNTLTSNTATGNDLCGIFLYDSSNNNTLTSSNASGNHIGIYLCGSSDNTLTSNDASGNDYRGICLGGSSDNTLTSNDASGNDLYGIRLSGSSNNNTITSNTASGNRYCGICLYGSSNNTLQGNTMSGNIYNFGVSGYLHILSDYTQNIDTSNTVDGKPIYYWVNQHDKQIMGDAGFVAVVNSTNITVKDLALTNNIQGVLFACTEKSRIENVSASDNRWGIYMDGSSNNTLTSNDASGNDDDGIYLCGSSDDTLTSNTASGNGNNGIYLYYSSDNTLTSNTVSGNGNDGIYLDHSSDNTFTSNNAAGNRYCGICIGWSSDNNTLTSNNAAGNGDNGIYLRGLSNNNTLYHNNLLDNTQNAYDEHTHQWDSGSAGNYYSDYTGTDNNTDGIGDTPYPIPGGGGSIDRFPLMQPWTATAPQKGDLNRDGKTTTADAAIAIALAASSEWDADADVNGDGRITALDALMIVQAAAGGIVL